MNFNRTNLKNIRVDIDEALKAVEAKYGIQLNIGNISFSDTEFTTKLTAVAAGSAAEAGKMEWDKWCFKYGLKESDFGRTFMSNGTEFTVTGIKPKSSKYPVLATNASGTTYKFTAAILGGFGPGTRTIY